MKRASGTFPTSPTWACGSSDDDGKRIAEPQPWRGGRRGGSVRSARTWRQPLGGGEGDGGGRRPRRREVRAVVPFQPWAAAVYDYNSKNESKYDPEGYCLPPGGPRMMATPYPAEIIQLPEQKRIIMIFEGATHIWREIFMDGRAASRRATRSTRPISATRSAAGKATRSSSDVVGFNEATWLDYFGHPHTDQLHVVERFTRPNKSTLHYEAIDRRSGRLHEAVQGGVGHSVACERASSSEYICQENNKYLQRLTDDFGQPDARQ